MTDSRGTEGTRQLIARIHRQRDELMQLPPERALQRILDAEHPAALVRALAEQDFHILVNDIGPEDALPLLALASNRQWMHLVDAEGWTGDRLALAEMDRWLDLMLRADPGRLAQWLATDHPDLLELFFYRTIEVFLREHDQEPSSLPPGCESLDGVYYFRLKPEADNDAVPDRDSDLCGRLSAGLIERLAAHDHILYQKVLLETMGVIPAELEEEAYRMRTVRMAEKGFLPFDEAVGIYQPPGAPSAAPQPPPPAGAIPVLPSRLSDPTGLFQKAMAALPPGADTDGLKESFAALCNRIGVADGTVARSREDLEALVAKAAGYIGIALEHLAGGSDGVDVTAAATVVARRPLAELFQTGYAAALDLKHRADRWRAGSWFQRRGLPLTFWGEQWMGVLGGLLIKRPRYFDNYRTGVIYREFATTAEISETRDALSAVMAMDALLEAVDLAPPRPTSLFVTYENLLITAWARHRLALEGPLAPLRVREMRQFFTWFWKTEAPPFHIDDTRRTAFLQWLADRSGQPSEALAERFGARLEKLFKGIEDELGGVAVTDLHPRYVGRLVLVTPT